MPAIAHLGIGLAAKRVSPKVPLLVLIIAAEFIEILFMGLWAAGIEHPPTMDMPPYSPYSHSVIMGLAWSVLAGLIMWVVSKNARTSWIIGLLVFSHTILDIIASPKTAFYPTDTGIPLFFNYSYTIGMGLWNNLIGAGVGETGIFVAGLVVYILTIRKIKPSPLRNKSPQ